MGGPIHCHPYGPEKQQSYTKFEGTRGAIIILLGVLMDYPKGVADAFESVILQEGQTPEWQQLEIEGSWFPHAFIGSMAQVRLAVESTIARPGNSVEGCIHTMAVVEAAYQSSAAGGMALERVFEASHHWLMTASRIYKRIDTDICAYKNTEPAPGSVNYLMVKFD
jgi:hypothetical protein